MQVLLCVWPLSDASKSMKLLMIVIDHLSKHLCTNYTTQMKYKRYIQNISNLWKNIRTRFLFYIFCVVRKTLHFKQQKQKCNLEIMNSNFRSLSNLGSFIIQHQRNSIINEVFTDTYFPDKNVWFWNKLKSFAWIA